MTPYTFAGVRTKGVWEFVTPFRRVKCDSLLEVACYLTNK